MKMLFDGKYTYNEMENISDLYETRFDINDFEPDHPDYKLLPRKEWITKQEWNEFLEKAKFLYWLSYEDILWEMRSDSTQYRLKTNN